MTGRFQVLLLGDDRQHLRWLGEWLGQEGCAAEPLTSTDECVARARDPRHACLVLDGSFDGRSTVATFAAVMASEPQFPVLFLVSEGDVRTCAQVMRAGAVDYLVKPTSIDELRDALRRAEMRSRALQAARARRDDVRMRLSRLTARERAVLERVVAGRRNKQIAAELSCEESTVKVHRSRLMRKLETRTLADLLRFAPHAHEALLLHQPSPVDLHIRVLARAGGGGYAVGPHAPFSDA